MVAVIATERRNFDIKPTDQWATTEESVAKGGADDECAVNLQHIVKGWRTFVEHVETFDAVSTRKKAAGLRCIYNLVNGKVQEPVTTKVNLLALQSTINNFKPDVEKIMAFVDALTNITPDIDAKS